MTNNVRKLVLGAFAAGALALALTDVSIAGIAAWKVVLGAIGLALLVWGGRPPHRSSR